MVVLGLPLPGGKGLGPGEPHRARFIGTGMHGGVIYLRGEVQPYQLGKEVGTAELGEPDRVLLRDLVAQYASHFGLKAEAILEGHFLKLFPLYLRPYGRLYTY